MKERPIPFSAPMVRALLDGSKTQTRRVGKIQSNEWTGLGVELSNHAKYGPQAVATYEAYPGRGTARHGICACPYGQPGDRLWVRETHAFTDLADGTPVVAYAADGQQIAIGRDTADGDDYLIHPYKFSEDLHIDRWKPSIHMPRWASRITLEITGVRVERLQDISEADAIAEGCTENHNGYFWGGPHAVSGLKQMAIAVSAYRDLWQSINGPGSWDANPWVWVVEFNRMESAC